MFWGPHFGLFRSPTAVGGGEIEDTDTNWFGPVSFYLSNFSASQTYTVMRRVPSVTDFMFFVAPVDITGVRFSVGLGNTGAWNAGGISFEIGHAAAGATTASAATALAVAVADISAGNAAMKSHAAWVDLAIPRGNKVQVGYTTDGTFNGTAVDGVVDVLLRVA
jgi:hypothetical protein